MQQPDPINNGYQTFDEIYFVIVTHLTHFIKFEPFRRRTFKISAEQPEVTAAINGLLTLEFSGSRTPFGELWARLDCGSW